MVRSSLKIFQPFTKSSIQFNNVINGVAIKQKPMLMVQV